MVTPQETRHKSKNVFNWKKKQVVALRLSMDINQEEREREIDKIDRKKDR
jgi:hypothetical protein